MAKEVRLYGLRVVIPAREELVLAAVGSAVAGIVFATTYEVMTVNAFTFPEHWGAMGDFIGGMLNPIVAVAALYMLVMSLKLQRKELEEARKVLAAQAESAEQSAVIAGYTAAINSAMSQVQVHQANIEFLVNQIHTGQISIGILGKDGDKVTRTDAYTHIKVLSVKIDELMKEQSYFGSRLKALLRENGDSAM